MDGWSTMLDSYTTPNKTTCTNSKTHRSPDNINQHTANNLCFMRRLSQYNGSSWPCLECSKALGSTAHAHVCILCRTPIAQIIKDEI